MQKTGIELKILIVSIASIHISRWLDQLKDSNHEVHYFNVDDGAPLPERLSWVHQHVGWRRRWDFPGRTALKIKYPKVSSWLERINERSMVHAFDRLISGIQPDVVHSIIMFKSVVPIYDVMQKFNHLKWMYSSWGSDLFLHQKDTYYINGIRLCLPKIDFLMTDCQRDYNIAVDHGFNGEFLGVFPGGGGYDMRLNSKYIKPTTERRTILIKGYENEIGRGLNVLRAIKIIENDLRNFNIVVFGASEILKSWVKDNLPLNVEVYEIISHDKVMEMMGSALIYLGNSISDGMPNTLIEAVIMGAFPIQSNPGGASEDIIRHQINGLLIEDPENIEEIAQHLKTALINSKLLEEAQKINLKFESAYGYETIRAKVLEAYAKVERVKK